MICPTCNLEAKAVKEIFTTKAIVHLSCGHSGFRNPNIGQALGWEEREVWNPTIGTVEKRRLPTEIDRRELLAEEVAAPVAPIDSTIVKADGEEDPSDEELLVQLEQVDKPKRKPKNI